ncbi:MAG: hypothetical protein IKA72_03465 [Clostridia bacterium]|nr:hypothetical protein [Clostridia bacterium]
MKQNLKKWVTRLACLAMTLFMGTANTSDVLTAFATAKTDEKAMTLELPSSARGTGADYLEIDLGSLNITGTHIGIKVNPVTATDQNGNSPKWSMFRFIFTDANGKQYNTDNFGGIDSVIPAANADGSATQVTWMYSYLWPLQGFYGTMYLPWALSNGGTEEKPTQAPTEIVKIRIQHNSSYTTARRHMLANFFTLTDATLVAEEKEVSYGDVKVFEDFENEVLSVTEKEIFNFGDVDLDAVTWSDNKVMEARTATTADLAHLEGIMSKLATEGFKSKYSTSGQIFDFSREQQTFGNALKWEYGSFYDLYDSKLNSYGSLTVPITGKYTDFRGAKGLTLWMKNPQPYPVSFNLEFAEADDTGNERWNLNGTDYRTAYFYDVVTGEEFSSPTLHVLFVPANFEGWIRLPFSQYACPSWSMGQGHDGIYEENNPHTNIYITSQFALNDSVTMYFDNIGLYYDDFNVGMLFGSTLPSIKDCVEGQK